MLIDALVSFIPPNSFVPITNAPVRSNIYDILGVGVGMAPPSIIGNKQVFGEDTGIGGMKPQVEAIIGQAFAGGTSLNVAFQGAVDTGVGGAYQPGTWITLVETGPIVTANLTLNQILARFDFPPAFPENVLPRYLSLLFTPVGTFTAGAISAAIVTGGRDDQSNRYGASNYTVA